MDTRSKTNLHAEFLCLQEKDVCICVFVCIKLMTKNLCTRNTQLQCSYESDVLVQVYIHSCEYEYMRTQKHDIRSCEYEYMRTQKHDCGVQMCAVQGSIFVYIFVCGSKFEEM
jgi:hypothetical protein